MTRVIVLLPLVHIHQLAILTTRNGRAAGICPALFWWAADEAGGFFGYGGGVVVESGHDQLVILLMDRSLGEDLLGSRHEGRRRA
jgi:hypothetical protein